MAELSCSKVFRGIWTHDKWWLKYRRCWWQRSKDRNHRSHWKNCPNPKDETLVESALGLGDHPYLNTGSIASTKVPYEHFLGLALS